MEKIDTLEDLYNLCLETFLTKFQKNIESAGLTFYRSKIDSVKENANTRRYIHDFAFSGSLFGIASQCVHEYEKLTEDVQKYSELVNHDYKKISEFRQKNRYHVDKMVQVYNETIEEVIKVVEAFAGGEGEGENCYRIYAVNFIDEPERYIRYDFFYYSHSGSEINESDPVVETKRIEKMVFDYIPLD